MIFTDSKIIPTIFPGNIDAGFGTKIFDVRDIHGRAQTMDQVHGDTITFISTQDECRQTDAMITFNTDTSLVVSTADCIPMLFFDMSTSMIAVSHQGYKGTLLRLPQKLIEKMVQYGACLDSILVAIGPSIGACCYPIYGERKNAFKKEFNKYSDRMFVQNNKDEMLDLKYINYKLLTEMGVLSHNIEYSHLCTKCRPELFSSYNRDGVVVSMYSYIRKKHE